MSILVAWVRDSKSLTSYELVLLMIQLRELISILNEIPKDTYNNQTTTLLDVITKKHNQLAVEANNRGLLTNA